MPLVENFATIMLRKLVLELQDRFCSRNFGRIELSIGTGMVTYLVDREPVFSRKEMEIVWREFQLKVD